MTGKRFKKSSKAKAKGLPKTGEFVSILNIQSVL